MEPHKSIEEKITDRNLPQADRLLYNIEDAFDEIESRLDSVVVKKDVVRGNQPVIRPT